MNIPETHVIDGTGFRLVRLQKAQIEQVRQWRNSESVRKYMAFRDEITPEMQEAWFAKLDPATQYYYIIETRDKPVGLINIKDVCDGEGEGGIFIADESVQNGVLPLQVIIAMYDFGFDVLGLHTIKAHILSSNTRAIRFNQSLGFKKLAGQEEVSNQAWTASRDDYFDKTRAMRAYLGK
ncbi:GNAT family N-acetyltransferase [Massilia sp. LjRoot122]|uniref:GNAT family N-acetyltransferase n=1 Tax=Massilia sp. LjRoot122 TaxID=3342257 RepID=UPI003ECF6989